MIVPFGAYFLDNWLFYFVPQLAAVCLARALGCRRPAALAGFSVALAGFLFALDSLPSNDPKQGVAVLILLLLGIPGGIAASASADRLSIPPASANAVVVSASFAALSFLALSACAFALFSLISAGK